MEKNLKNNRYILKGKKKGLLFYPQIFPNVLFFFIFKILIIIFIFRKESLMVMRQNGNAG